jgi:hypothetical protein
MFILRSIFVVGLSLAVTAAATAAPNINRRQRGNTGIEGTIVQVHRNRSPRNAGWIKVHRGSVRYYGRRRGTSTLAAASRRYGARRGGVMMFHVNSSTRFQRLGQRGRGAARLGFGAIHRGERVRVYLGGNAMARLVDVLPNAYSYHRTRHPYVHRNRHGAYHHRRNVYHRNPLVGNRVLVRTGRRPPVLVNRPLVVNRRIVVHSTPHPLIQGRVAARRTRQVVAAKVVKHAASNRKAPPPKHVAAHKPPAKHPATHKAPAHHPTSRPHSSPHRRK